MRVPIAPILLRRLILRAKKLVTGSWNTSNQPWNTAKWSSASGRFIFGRARGAPTTTEGWDDRPADIGEVKVREWGAICAGVQGAEEGFQEASEGIQLLPETEVELVAVSANDHQRDVVSRKIIGKTLRDFLENRGDKFLRRDFTEEIDDTQQAFFAEHLAIGVARFDECVRVTDEAVARVELDV